MHKYEARISWKRDGASFSDNRYSRAHAWTFDGGTQVPASSSPQVVPLPYSTLEGVDPEEALVASASSCHMLWFLHLAVQRGFVVDAYEDEAFGVMGRNSDKKIAFTRITLRPQVRFAEPKLPSAGELSALHHDAHEECFIASSLKCDVVVEVR